MRNFVRLASLTGYDGGGYIRQVFCEHCLVNGRRAVTHGMVRMECKRRLYSMWSGTQKEWADTGFDMDYVSDPKSWRGPSPIVYKNPGPYKQPESVGNDGFGGAFLFG